MLVFKNHPMLAFGHLGKCCEDFAARYIDTASIKNKAHRPNSALCLLASGLDLHNKNIPTGKHGEENGRRYSQMV